MRPRIRATAAVIPLALALALTGCGSDGDGGGTVASVGGDKKAGGGGSAPTLSPEETGMKFARCMRENGVAMDDPEPGKGIRLTVRKGDGVSEATMEKAMEACREYGPDSKGAAPNPEMEEKGRAFAECMRKNGVENFPDPQPGQRGIRITGEMGKDPDFDKAHERCQSVLSGGPGSPTTGGR